MLEGFRNFKLLKFPFIFGIFVVVTGASVESPDPENNLTIHSVYLQLGRLGFFLILILFYCEFDVRLHFKILGFSVCVFFN